MSVCGGEHTTVPRRSPSRRAGAGIVVAAMSSHPFPAAGVDVDADEARRRIDAGEVQLVDVREPQEWDAGRIAGARHIELDRLQAEAGTLDPERPVLFYCRVGGRSGMAANAFRRAGYDAYSLDGGLIEWRRRGLPLEPDGGTVAQH